MMMRYISLRVLYLASSGIDPETHRDHQNKTEQDKKYCLIMFVCYSCTSSIRWIQNWKTIEKSWHQNFFHTEYLDMMMMRMMVLTTIGQTLFLIIYSFTLFCIWQNKRQEFLLIYIIVSFVFVMRSTEDTRKIQRSRYYCVNIFFYISINSASDNMVIRRKRRLCMLLLCFVENGVYFVSRWVAWEKDL